MQVRELSDAEVFGARRPRELSDAEVMRSAGAPYQPQILPLRRGQSGGLEFVTPQVIRDLWSGVEAPGKVLRGEIAPTMENLQGAARQTTGAITTGGIAVPRAVIPAGAAAMNAIGPPARAAGHAVVQAGQTIASPVTNRIDPDGALGRMLARRLMQQNPNMSLEQAVSASRARLAELGPQAVMADLGMSTRNLARNMAQGPGETAQRARSLADVRQGGEKTRQIANIRQNVSDVDYYDADEASELAMKAAGPHFEEAFRANPSVSSKRIDKILETPAGRAAFEFARKRVKNRMDRMATPDPELTEQMRELVARGEMDAVTGGVASGLKLRTLDLIRQDLYDQMQQMKVRLARGDVRKGEYDEIKDLYSDFRQELVNLDATAKAGPNSTKAEGGAYERGLNEYASAARLQGALERGRSFIKGDQEITEQMFRALSPQERDAYRTGVGQELVAMIRRDNTDFTPRQIIAAIRQESGMRAKLRAILPSEQQFNDFVRNIERDMAFRETHQGVRNVSQTASIAMEEGEIAGDTLATLGGGAVDVLRGRTEQAFGRAMGWALGQLRRIQMPQEQRDRLGRLLLSQEQADKEEAFRLIQQWQTSAGGRPTGR
jgi:hypothetical protein